MTSSTLIVVAPAFVAASLYQLLAHIILGSGSDGVLGGSKLMTKLALGCGFGALDLLGFALQAAGENLLFPFSFAFLVFRSGLSWEFAFHIRFSHSHIYLPAWLGCIPTPPYPDKN
jgi:hypothetical protein